VIETDPKSPNVQRPAWEKKVDVSHVTGHKTVPQLVLASRTYTTTDMNHVCLRKATVVNKTN